MNQKNNNLSRFRRKPFAFMFFVARKKKWFGIGAFVCVVIAAVLQSLIYPLVGQITDALTTSSSLERNIYILFFLLIAIFIAKNIIHRMSGYLASHWITFVEIFSVQIPFDYLLDHSAAYFADNLSGKLQNKLYNIANAISRTLSTLLWSIIPFVVKVIALIVIAFLTDPIIGWVIIPFIVVALVYNLIASRKISVYSHETANRSSYARGVIVDIISNIMAVKQNCATKRESRRVYRVLDRYRIASRKTWWRTVTVILINNFIIIAMFVITMIAALFSWQSGVASVGSIVTLFTMLIMLYGDLEFLSMTFTQLMEQHGQLKEGLDAVFVPHMITDKENAKKVTIKEGEIVFNHVSFHYHDNDAQLVLNDLTLTIPAGQKIGLVGESGAGKSTFVSLLLRFHDVDKGKIKIDGYDLREIRQDDLRKAIAYVPQEALLFHRTLIENIKYSNESATKEKVEDVAKRANALEFITRFPEKFETLVGERGIKLSGGQKQRVMIARAMLKSSPILVLDEATSSLDSASEKMIQEALEELMKGRTTIVIAHRLSTLKQMDRIIVFEGGKVVEDGTHDELLAKKGKYFALWQHQSSALR